MFENRYPILAIGKAFDGIGHGPLKAYVRWEYRPGERTAVLAALHRTGASPSRRRRGWARRIAARLRRGRAPSGIRTAGRPHGARRPLRPAELLGVGLLRGALL